MFKEDATISVFDWEGSADGLLYCFRCQSWISVIDAYNEGGDSHVIDHVMARALMREIVAS